MAADRVVLVRHGESEWNAAGRWQGHEGTGLSAQGRRQADVTAAFLAATEHDVRLLVSSDLQRVTETARPVAEALGLPVVIDVRLREIDVGWWAGLTQAQIAERDPDAFAAIRSGEDLARGGAETARELRDRVVVAVTELSARCDGGTMIMLSHGGPVRAMVGATLGLSVAQQRALAGPGNCSRTELVVRDGRVRLRCYNETAHLLDT